MKLSEAVDYAIELNPQHCFPVHDFILSDAGQAVAYRMTNTVVSPKGIQFHPLEIGKAYDF